MQCSLWRITKKGILKMYLPEDDSHFAKSAKKGYYQRHTTLLSMAHVKCWDTAVDIGGHVGFVSRDMAKFFKTVHAFEPVPENLACLIKNVPDNVIPHGVAMGAEIGVASFENPSDTNSGAWEMVAGSDVKVKTLDSYDLENVGLIKIDTQGCEYDVLRGAVETIKRCRPVIQAECVGKDTNPEALELLRGLGATLAATVREDGIWVFR